MLAEREGMRVLLYHPRKGAYVIMCVSLYVIGASALYISGSGVATASYGLPDLGTKLSMFSTAPSATSHTVPHAE